MYMYVCVTVCYCVHMYMYVCVTVHMYGYVHVHVCVWCVRVCVHVENVQLIHVVFTYQLLVEIVSVPIFIVAYPSSSSCTLHWIIVYLVNTTASKGEPEQARI